MSDGLRPRRQLSVVERPRARYTVSFSCGSLQKTVRSNQVITSSLSLRDLYTILSFSLIVLCSSGVAWTPESLALRYNSTLGFGACQLDVRERESESERK